MSRLLRGFWLVLWVLPACVTINVYFPAAAAEKAADRIIEEVWGKLAPEAQQTPAAPQALEAPASASPPPQSRLQHVLDFLVAPAHAQDINVSTPAINAIKNAMAARHAQLEPFYNSGAVGLTADGGVMVRDLNAVPLKDRNAVKQRVAQENDDRAKLYREIAAANGQPQWEDDIRNTFARQWIEQARPGWWYQAGGGWQQK